MFMLYAIPLGLLVGPLVGGKLDGLAAARLHLAPLFVLATLARMLLFEARFGETEWGRVAIPLVNVGVPALLLLALLPNLRYRGAQLALLGVACNLAAITANGGWMPVDPVLARDAFGDAVVERLARGEEASNVKLADAGTRLVLLTDVIAMPRSMPLANVISVGDILGGLGVAGWIVELMRSRYPGTANGASPRLSL